MSREATTETSAPRHYACRWDWCREQFADEFDLRDHVMRAHVETSQAVPKQSLHVWQSSNGVWKGRQKDYLPTRRAAAAAPQPDIEQSPTIQHRMEVDSMPIAANAFPTAPMAISKPSSGPLQSHGIPRSQEALVVTQVFSPYITSSDEQPPSHEHTNTPASASSQTHARNPSNESASLPQSHDYETVPGILPRIISQATSSPAQQPADGSGSTTTSDGTKERTTPLRVGIAFGALPNVTSGSEESGSSSGLFAAKTEKPDVRTGGPVGPPNGKKISDKSVRFGFGNR